MLKLRNTSGDEYEVIGHITFYNEGETDQTNYTIVVDGVTETVSSLDGEWTAVEVEDVVPEPEPTPEPVPEPVILVTPEPTPEQLEAQEAEGKKAEFLAKLAEWDAQRVAGLFLTARGGVISQEDGMAFMTLEQWLLNNWKKEYAIEAKPFLTNLGL